MKNKNILKLLIIISFMICISINARTIYNNTPNFSNDYLKRFSKYTRYLVTTDSPYGYENGEETNDIEYKTGGLLNEEEFIISKDISGETYLFNGLEYWTMTRDENEVTIVDPNSATYLGIKLKSSESGIRVTNYVQNGVYLRGKGTIADPWTFVEKYYVKFNYDDAKVTINPQSTYVPNDGAVVATVINRNGYVYSTNDCGAEYIENENVSESEPYSGRLIINNIRRDITCNVTTALRKHKITYKPDGICNPSYKELKHGQKFGTLCAPTKTGYTFDGWYDEETGGTNVNSNTIAVEDMDLYAHLTVNELTFNDKTVTATFSTSAQTKSNAVNAASNGTGTYTYAITGGNTDSYFSLSGRNLTIKANTPVNTYTLTIKATDSNSGSEKSATYTITINKVNATCPTLAAYTGTYDGSSHTITVSGGSGGTIKYRTSTSGSWTTTKPYRTDVGTTTVYVEVEGDSNHNTKDCGNKKITINEAGDCYYCGNAQCAEYVWASSDPRPGICSKDTTKTYSTCTNTKVTSVSLSGSSSVDVGSTITLSVTVSPSNATCGKVIWSSSDTSKATVTDAGIVTGKSAGSVTIKATSSDGSGKKATKTITVNESSSGGNGCFPKGTKIMTILGPKNIDEIKVGTFILTYNIKTGKQEYSRVKHHLEYKNLNETLYTLKFDDGNKLKITHLHRVYIIRNNVSSYVRAEDVRVGDKVLYADNTIHNIIMKTSESYNKPVYNIEVENNHNFYVGDNYILVHNISVSGLPEHDAYK
jgi:uncharacterized repeat protein (TIGR02543 family)